MGSASALGSCQRGGAVCWKGRAPSLCPRYTPSINSSCPRSGPPEKWCLSWMPPTCPCPPCAPSAKGSARPPQWVLRRRRIPETHHTWSARAARATRDPQDVPRSLPSPGRVNRGIPSAACRKTPQSHHGAAAAVHAGRACCGIPHFKKRPEYLLNERRQCSLVPRAAQGTRGASAPPCAAPHTALKIEQRSPRALQPAEGTL